MKLLHILRPLNTLILKTIRVFNSSSLIVKVLGLVPISGFNPASLKLLVCLVSEGF
jgi:hypothetical protein